MSILSKKVKKALQKQPTQTTGSAAVDGDYRLIGIVPEVAKMITKKDKNGNNYEAVKFIYENSLFEKTETKNIPLFLKDQVEVLDELELEEFGTVLQLKQNGFWSFVDAGLGYQFGMFSEYCENNNLDEDALTLHNYLAPLAEKEGVENTELATLEEAEAERKARKAKAAKKAKKQLKKLNKLDEDDLDSNMSDVSDDSDDVSVDDFLKEVSERTQQE